MASVTKEQVQAWVEQRQWQHLRERLQEWPAAEVADLLLELEKPDRVVLFRLLPRALSSEVFTHLERTHRRALLQDLTDEETRQLLAALPPDDRTHLFAELPGRVTQELLNQLSPEDLRETRWLLGYPDESVGRLMTPDYVAVRPDWSIQQALDHIRRYGRESETLDAIYVVDAQWKLVDALELRRFVLARPENTVAQVMDQHFVSLAATADREEAVQMMQRYDLAALPVVDSGGVLLGIVTVDDVLDVAQEEATEDFHKVAAIDPLRTSYRQASIWTLFQRRFYWLAMLVVLNLVSSGIIAAYEDALAAAVALAFFIPLLIDSGGNSGSQAATMMIRALVIGEIHMRDWAQTLLKEIGVGLLLGVSLALLATALGLYRGGPEIGLIVGLAMICIILLSNLIGMTLPFVLSWVRVDPAVASSPLITSICDAVGLIIYFFIASRVLEF